MNSFHDPLCWDYFHVIVKEAIEARYGDDLCPFLAVSHFLLAEKEVAFLSTKEVAMRRTRAPPERWRIHTVRTNTSYQR
jgi:hypothetical protein